jgi:hypothetical protein
VCSLHWSVHSNGRLGVDVHGLDAVEPCGVKRGAVIAGGDDASGAMVRPRLYALRALLRLPAKSSRQAQGRRNKDRGRSFSRFVGLIPLDCAQARALHDSPLCPNILGYAVLTPPIFRASNVGGILRSIDQSVRNGQFHRSLTGSTNLCCAYLTLRQ